MPITKHNDLETYYEIHGQGEPLILIAGYSCDHTVWTGVLDTLAKNFQVVIFDNRAIGQTKDAGNKFTIETLADDVIALMRALKLEKAHLVGQSMGGAIAQTIASKYPQQVKKLIILNSVMQFALTSAMALENSVKLRQLDLSLDTVIDSVLPWVFSSEYLAKPSNIKSFKELVANNPYPQSIEDQLRQLAAIRLFNSRDMVRTIKSPTLVVAAESDLITPLITVEKLARNIDHAIFATTPGGHASLTEQPRKVGEIMLGYLVITN